MGVHSKIFLLLALAVMLSGCSGKKSAPRELEVSFGALVANDLVGGAIVRVENASTGAYTDVDLSVPPFTVMVADGKWNFYFVGFVGPAAWGGITHCGGALGVNLGSATAVIDITVNAATCGSNPYAALIATKVSNWDQALWNQSKWGI